MTKSSLSSKTLPLELSSRDELQNYPRRSADVEGTEGISTPTEDRGDLLMRNIWKHQTDCILDVRITKNLDAPSNIRRQLEAFLLSNEREKKKKYLRGCLDQRRHFSPFVVSSACDGVFGNEAKLQ